MGMFGVTVINNTLIDVQTSRPGMQELAIQGVSSTYSGSHQKFWDQYYTAAGLISPMVDPHLSFALTPISGTRTWQIEQRNLINYKTKIAIEMADSFRVTFNKNTFPASLPGKLGTQYRFFEASLQICFGFARALGIHTDALSALTPNSLNKAIKEMIYNPKAPNVVSKTNKGVLCNR